jgi:hypothetical protein
MDLRMSKGRQRMSDPVWDLAPMQNNRLLGFGIGDVVEVQPVTGGSPLPDGLPTGAQVRVIRLRSGSCGVERDGREWEVLATCVVPRRTIRVRPTLSPGRCPQISGAVRG